MVNFNQCLSKKFNVNKISGCEIYYLTPFLGRITFICIEILILVKQGNVEVSDTSAYVQFYMFTFVYLLNEMGPLHMEVGLFSVEPAF